VIRTEVRDRDEVRGPSDVHCRSLRRTYLIYIFVWTISPPPPPPLLVLVTDRLANVVLVTIRLSNILTL
jgi:hypothetical protein